MLSTVGDVRAAIENAFSEKKPRENLEQQRRVSVAGYLLMLAEEVRRGNVTEFELSWSGGGRLDTQCRFAAPAEYVPVDLVPDIPAAE